MRHTKRQTTRRTLTDLYRALDHQHAITITYRDTDGEETIRTVELHELRTTKTGGIELIVMCRLRNAERKLALAGVLTYTVHRSGYVLTRPEPAIYERPELAPADSETALVVFELERDPDDANHRPRMKLTQTGTELAA